ncbi:hypothetical protein [Alkaliphilus peptidifermentans]|uniref:Uncharacterized protein n=1 Tax=Alkaliphilus peptidifermentans DSM 18978 TaxID=1120976 RepID=A0A1G5GTP8_9FIRM|nr:hypothetical protein [Alkaliphilus peptidifermentans]SCY54965.1 hypothetical protein SAMN03080606_01776 [Alkaliphilus peptidifermentans DSM 18978]
MKKLLVIVVIIMMLVIPGCRKTNYSNNQSVVSSSEYQFMQDKMKILEEENKTLKSELESLKNLCSSSTEKAINSQNKKEVTQLEYDTLELKLKLLIEENENLKKELKKYMGPSNYNPNRDFDPRKVKIGDDIGGFRVTQVYIDDYDMEKVFFDGYFVMKGKLITNFLGESRYGIRFHKEDIIRNIPIPTTWELDKRYGDYSMFFRLLSDEVVAQAIGKEVEENIWKNAQHGVEVKYNIIALFNEFEYWTQPNTDVTSSLKLVKLIYIEEEIDHN